MTEFDLSTREGRWKHFGSVDPIDVDLLILLRKGQFVMHVLQKL
jgi:hypothetical protein